MYVLSSSRHPGHFGFFFFCTQVQTPGTLCSGEWWRILVVRLAHSADLRSRLRHVSSAPSFAYSTRCSRVVTCQGTSPARRCLTSVIWWEPVCQRRLAVDIFCESVPWQTLLLGFLLFLEQQRHTSTTKYQERTILPSTTSNRQRARVKRKNVCKSNSATRWRELERTF